MNGWDFQMPPGFRYHPTDWELVVHYLCRKNASMPIPFPFIPEIDLYKFDPWVLPLVPYMAWYGEKEWNSAGQSTCYAEDPFRKYWYFFSQRDRKYPNGSRAAGSGYWKATGADKPIGGPKPVAFKEELVFYAGKAPNGEKTNWIMHEYRLADVDRSTRRKNNSLRLDDWVLCRIYKKEGGVEKPNHTKAGPAAGPATPERKPEILPHLPAAHVRQPFADMFGLDTSGESLPRLHGDSRCGSEHVLSSSDLTWDREVSSQLAELERALGVPRGLVCPSVH